MRQRILSLLGICGCASCYITMFPTILIGFIGIMGISTAGAAHVLTSYQNSFLFLPIFIISLLFLVLSVIHHGKTIITLVLSGSIGVFVSMTFYIQSWLFTLSFALIALAYFLSYRKTRMNSLKFSFILLILVVVIGAIDTTRGLLIKPSAKTTQSVNQMTGMTK